MASIRSESTSREHSPFVAGVAAMAEPQRGRAGRTESRVQPFVTISRQAGAGGWTLAQGLVERLNRQLEPGQRPWRAYDDELIDKVASDHKVSKRLIENLDDRTPSWLEDFFTNVSAYDKPSEEMLFHRVAATICALAQEGRVVIVGRGGVYVTRDMPAGIHIRLIAPIDYRVRFLADKQGLSRSAAARRIQELDAHREKFYRRYCPGEVFSPELFTLTMNTAMIPDAAIVDCVLSLLDGSRAGAGDAAESAR